MPGSAPAENLPRGSPTLPSGQQAGPAIPSSDASRFDPCNKVIQKYYKEAGIRKKASVHTLRHTFATHQIHNGLKLNQLQAVLGHKKMETTYKYVHLDRTNLRQGMEQGAL